MCLQNHNAAHLKQTSCVCQIQKFCAKTKNRLPVSALRLNPGPDVAVQIYESCRHMNWRQSPVQYAGSCRGGHILLRLLCQPALHNIHLQIPKYIIEKAHRYRILLLRGRQMRFVLPCECLSLLQPRLQVNKGWGPTTLDRALST